jgi:small-conductance mechanosensitive channel/CRP-like cAMP-binding protein
MAEPAASTLRELPHLVISRLGRNSALGVALAATLILILAALLPRSERIKQIRTPSVLLFLYILLLLAHVPLDQDSTAAHAVAILGFTCLLLSLGRTLFILVVDVLIGARLKRPMPRIFRDIIQGLFYAAVALGILRAAGVEPGSLLTTSALITAVVGLSLQDTLGNLFAGLALQAQTPFEVGDWIQIDQDPRNIGRVIEINWRATKVLTNDQVELVIPNAALAKTTIANYTKPTKIARRTVTVQAPYEVSPRRVEQALLGALHAVPGIIHSTPPFVLLSRFDDSGITYSLCYFIEDFATRDRIDSTVRQRIWFSFQRAGISIPFPIRTVYSQTISTEGRAADREQGARLQALRNVDFLAALPDEALERLAGLCRTAHFMNGEVIIRQGEPGSDLFVVERGEVAVIIGRGKDASVAEVARLGPGKFFGEMSLMTGERRAATVQATADCELVQVGKAAFQEILESDPRLAEQITQILVERQNAIEENITLRKSRNRGDTDAKNSALLAKIRQFFAL